MIKSILKLFSANAAGQVFAFLLLPLIARLYSEEDMGIMGLFLTVTGLLSLFANGKYEFAILLEREASKVMFRLTFLINLVFSLALAIVLAIAGNEIFALLDYTPLLPYTIYIAPFVFLSALAVSLSHLNNAVKQFSRTATFSFTQVALNNLLKLAPLLYRCDGAFMLIVSNLLSFLFAMPLLLRGIKAKEHTSVSLATLASKHRRFPLYTLPQSVVNYFSANAVVLLLSAYFDMAEIGLLVVANTLGSRPLSLLCNSLEQVLAQNMAANGNRAYMRTVVNRYTFNILIYGTPLFAALYFIIPLFLDVYLPARWSASASYLQLLLPMLLLSLLVAPLSCIPSILGAQRQALIAEVLILFGRCTSILIGAQQGCFYTAILYYSIASATIFFLQYLWFRHLLRKQN